jgi:hypothetical protein
VAVWFVVPEVLQTVCRLRLHTATAYSVWLLCLNFLL